MAQGYPGITFTTLGPKIQQILNGPTTWSVLIFGSAQDGPIDDVVVINDPTQVEAIFGPADYEGDYLNPATGIADGAYAGSTIPLEISKAIAAGCQDVRVFRVIASYATGSMGTLGVPIRSFYPGQIYNQVYVTTDATTGTFTLSINAPLAKGGNQTFTYDSLNTTLIEFINQANSTPAISQTIFLDDSASVLQPYLSYSLNALASQLTGAVTLSGGTNGCFAKGDDYGPEQFTSGGTGLFGYANALVAQDVGVFDLVRGKRRGFDFAVLTGIHVDDQVVNGANATTTSIMADFADFIDACRSELQPCHGIMSVRPHGLRDDLAIINYVNNNLLTTQPAYWNQDQKWICAGPILFAGRQRPGALGPVDVYSNVSVIAGPQVIYNHPDMGGDYTTEWGTAYAAFLTTLDPESSATQTPIPGIKGFTKPYHQKYAQLLLQGVGSNGQDLSGMGAYVTLVYDQQTPFGALVVNDDVTAGARDSTFRNYQTIHCCNSIEKDLEFVLKPYLGKSTGAGRLAAMGSAIQNVLDGYVASEALRGPRGQGYDFQVLMQGTDAAIGTVTVVLWVALAASIHRINLIVNVKQTS